MENKKFNPCLLLISYVSDTDSKRAEKCRELVKKLDELFNLPILALITGWETEELPVSPNIKYYRFNDRGISIARRVLRSVALASDYNYFIMFDDDTEIKCTEDGVKTYLRLLKEHPDGYTVTGVPMMLKCFAVSRYIFEKVDYAPFTNNIQNEKGKYLGFEDAAFAGECLLRFPDKGFWSAGVYNWTDVNHFSFESTWLNEETSKYLPLQFHNTKQYLLNISDMAPYYFGFLRLYDAGSFKCDPSLLYPSNQETEDENKKD